MRILATKVIIISFSFLGFSCRSSDSDSSNATTTTTATTTTATTTTTTTPTTTTPTTTTLPPTLLPSNVTLTPVTVSSLRLGWVKPKGAIGLTGFNISWSGRSTDVHVDEDISSYLITNLTVAGAKYTVNISAIYDGIRSSEKFTISQNTNVSAPLNVTVVYTNETSLQVKWTNPNGKFDGFNISCSGYKNLSSKNSSVVVRGNSSSAVCPNATAGALYECRVSSFVNDTLLLTNDSQSAFGVTVPFPPYASATTTNKTSIQLQLNYSFLRTVSQCTHYKIFAESQNHSVDCRPPNLTYFHLTRLNSDSLVSVSVYAVSNYYSANGLNLSKTSPSPTLTSAWTLAEPVSLNGNASVTSSSLEVAFQRPSSAHKNVLHYVIRVNSATQYIRRINVTCNTASNIQPGQVNCAKNENVSLNSNSMTTSCSNNMVVNITGLRPFTNYSVSVEAVNPGGCSDTTRNTFMTAGSVPGCVDIVNASSLSNSIFVAWKPPQEPNGIIKGYSVSYLNGDHESESNTIFTNDTRLQVTGLFAYDNYTVKVAAVNHVGVGIYDGCSQSVLTVQTKIGRPFPVTLSASVLNSSSANVTWTPEIDRETAPLTFYNLTVTDKYNEQVVNRTTVEGFNQRSLVFLGLDEYWNYSVDIISFVFDEENDVLISNGSSVVFTTNQSIPGPVETLTVKSLSTQEQCYSAQVTWTEPSLRDRNGIITGYKVEWNQSRGSEKMSQEFKQQETSATLSVKPDGQMYLFTIRAKTQIGYGTAKSETLSSTGSCMPNHTEEVNAVINSTVQPNPEYATTKSFPVVYDSNFFAFNLNGEVMFSGLLVREEDSSRSYEEKYGNYTLFNESTTWSEAIREKTIPEYRATPENWLQDSSSAEAKVSALSESALRSFVIGENDACPKQSMQHCNGPLPSDRKYRVRPIICTRKGCYVPLYPTAVFRTKPSDTDAIAAAAATSVVLVALVTTAIVAFIFYRRRRLNKGYRKNSNRPDLITMDQAAGFAGFCSPPNPIRLDDFPGHVQEMHCDSDLQFSVEYTGIQSLSPKHSWSEAEKPENKGKNRFVNILPYNSSRVILQNNNRTGSDYINANYMPGESGPGEYIATQGPLPNTLEDFWAMIWQEKVDVIVMLTNLKESGRDKCALYWPMSSEKIEHFGSISVELKREEKKEAYVVRTLVASQNENSRFVHQYHYTVFPDFGIPADSVKMMDFVTTVRHHIGSKNSKSPTVVHCSAGVGRTGTFIALDRLLRQVREFHRETIDIFQIVLQLRDFRCQMVQTESQYVFLHDCLQLELIRINIGGLDNGAFEPSGEEPLYVNQTQIKRESATVKSNDRFV